MAKDIYTSNKAEYSIQAMFRVYMHPHYVTIESIDLIVTGVYAIHATLLPSDSCLDK